jgi:hypothetical protein
MTFLQEIKDLAAVQEHLEDALHDPITLVRMECPIIECSDGRKYALGTMRSWVRECMTSHGFIQSPRGTGEILRPHAVDVTRTVVDSCRAVGLNLDTDGSEDAGGGDVDLLQGLDDVAHKNKGGDVVEWTVNVAAKLHSDVASEMCVRADMQGEEDVRFWCHTRTHPRGHIELLCPPPDPSLRDAFASICEELGIGASAIINPECIGTVNLQTRDGTHDSWEARIIRREAKTSGNRQKSPIGGK